MLLRVPSALTVHAAALLVGASVSSAARRPLVHIPRDACLALPGSCLSPSSRRRCNPSLCAALPRIVHRRSSPHPVVLRRLVPAQTEQSTCLQRHVIRHHSKRASHSSAARDCIFTPPVPRTPTPRPDQPCHILHVHVHIHGKQLSPPAKQVRPIPRQTARDSSRRIASLPAPAAAPPCPVAHEPSLSPASISRQATSVALVPPRPQPARLATCSPCALTPARGSHCIAGATVPASVCSPPRSSATAFASGRECCGMHVSRRLRDRHLAVSRFRSS